MPDGRIYDGYFPSGGDPETIDVVPGTHVSSSFLAYWAFNKYVLDTPLYRSCLVLLNIYVAWLTLGLSSSMHLSRVTTKMPNIYYDVSVNFILWNENTEQVF